MTAVGGKDKGGNSNGRGHRQQSTNSDSKDMVTVATATETAAACAATTAMGVPTTAPGIGANGIAFATSAGTAMTDVGAATSVAIAARTAWCFGRGVAHIVQYFSPLLEEVHAPHSQSEAEEEEAMMGGLSVLVVVVRVTFCSDQSLLQLPPTNGNEAISLPSLSAEEYQIKSHKHMQYHFKPNFD
jgi:hypothetical protein